MQLLLKFVPFYFLPGMQASHAAITVVHQVTQIAFIGNYAYLGGGNGEPGEPMNAFSADFSHDTEFRFTISAPQGFMFFSDASFGPRLNILYVAYNGSIFKDSELAGPPTISFTNAIGTMGQFSGGNEFMMNSLGTQLGIAVSTTEFSSVFGFSSVTFSWEYDATTLIGGDTQFLPTSGSILLQDPMPGTPGEWLKIVPIPEPSVSHLIMSAATILVLFRQNRKG